MITTTETTPPAAEGALAGEDPQTGKQKHVTGTELLGLPAFVNLSTAARVLGLGRNTAYELARTDRFPCRLLKFGKTYRVPSEELRRLAGVERPDPPVPAADSCCTDLRLPQPVAPAAGAGRCPTCYARVYWRRGVRHVDS